MTGKVGQLPHPTCSVLVSTPTPTPTLVCGSYRHTSLPQQTTLELYLLGQGQTALSWTLELSNRTSIHVSARAHLIVALALVEKSLKVLLPELAGRVQPLPKAMPLPALQL